MTTIFKIHFEGGTSLMVSYEAIGNAEEFVAASYHLSSENQKANPDLPPWVVTATKQLAYRADKIVAVEVVPESQIKEREKVAKRILGAFTEPAEGDEWKRGYDPEESE